MIKLDDDGRASAITFLESVVHRLKDPSCSSTSFKYLHQHGDECVYHLVVDITPPPVPAIVN